VYCRGDGGASPSALWRPKSRPTALQRPDPGYGLSLVTLPLAALATTTSMWFAPTDRARPASQRHRCCGCWCLERSFGCGGLTPASLAFLTPDGRKFLGFEVLDRFEPNTEL